MIHEMFPEEYLQLDQELSTPYHPKLQELLRGFGPDDMDQKLSRISHYVGIVLNDCYTLDDRRKLCDLLRQRLILLREQEKDKSIVIIN
jgi:hypothetical protein